MATNGAGRLRTAPAIAALTALVLVLVFGSPMYEKWSRTAGTGAGHFFLRLLAWPAWSFDTSRTVRDLLSSDIRAILVIVFAAGFAWLMVAGGSVRGVFGQLFVGWGTYIFGSALAGLVSAFIAQNASFLAAFTAAAAGAAYGLFIGWVVGIALAAARH